MTDPEEILNPEVPYRSSLRKTNPSLFRSLITVALGTCALGFNFLLTVPTFEQFGIPKNFIGAGFMTLGILLLVFLLLHRSLRAVRVVLTVNIAYLVFWGVGTTQTFFQGTSSLQLFILYWTLAALQIPLLLEPFRPSTAPETVEEKEGRNG